MRLTQSASVKSNVLQPQRVARPSRWGDRRSDDGFVLHLLLGEVDEHVDGAFALLERRLVARQLDEHLRTRRPVSRVTIGKIPLIATHDVLKSILRGIITLY